MSQSTLQESIVDCSIDQLYTSFSGFVAFRLPKSSEAQVFVSDKHFTALKNPAIHQLPLGFLVKDFDPDSGISWFLQPQQSFVFDAAWQVKTVSHKHQNIDQGILVENQPQPQSLMRNNKSLLLEGISEEDYRQQVELAVEAIEVGNFDKVVLARKTSQTLENSVSPELLFKRACEKYPDAFVYILKWEDGSFWLGASPELLVSSDSSTFCTQALAGTRRRLDVNQSIQQTLWSQKEIEEQAIVSRYIIDCFKKIRVREYTDIGPHTVLAGDLLHLKTDFIVKKSEANYEHIETEMLRLLHPTSAVCGMPKPEALRFIKQVEKFDRELYSGYLGPLHVDGKSHVFVNLRCAKVEGTILHLFAGAGITSSSVSAAEWTETQVKLQTMLQVFGV